jgi:hypothetical protein
MPTMPLPQTLMSVLAAFAPCFTVRTFATFQALVVGFLAQPGARTVTGMLTGAGLAGRRHHDLAYRFFASARWSADQVGLVVAGLAVGCCLPMRRCWSRSMTPCCAAAVASSTGPRGTTTAQDLAGTARRGATVGRAGVLVRVPFVAHRPLCLPVLARLWRPGATDHTPSVLARELLDLLTERFSERTPPAPGAGCPAASRSPPGCAATRRCTRRLRPRPGCPADLGSKAPGSRT